MTITTKPTAVGAALSLTMLALAGCGPRHDASASAGGAPAGAAVSSASAKTFDPCVLTADEVSTITDDKVTRTSVNAHECNYTTFREGVGPHITIYLTDGRRSIQEVRDTNKQIETTNGAVASQDGASGIGDEAVWQADGALSVRKGDKFVEVLPSSIHDPATHHGMLVMPADRRATARKLAEAVLAKLGT